MSDDPHRLRDHLRVMSADAASPAVRAFYLRWIAAIDEQIERARAALKRGRDLPHTTRETN